MNVAALAAVTMMMHNNHMMLQEQARMRRQREERYRKQREDEQRRREEKQRKEIEYRKNSPVVYNNEGWQQDRCIKAMSMQPCVQDLISIIEKTRPEIIKKEEQKYDEKLIEIGQKYSLIKRELDKDIENLRQLGITISGTKYKLLRLVNADTNMIIPEQTTETYGNTFKINDSQTIELNQNILSTDGYYEDRYEEMNPEELEQEFNETNSKIKKYQKYGKFLKFLLKTNKYLELEKEFEDLTDKHEQCELRKKEMESFKSLSKEQLLLIKSYFIHLDQLITISFKIKSILHAKELLRDDNNEIIYDLAIRNVISNDEYRNQVAQTYEYIDKIQSNDEETLNQAYELVKGKYPINVSKRYVYDTIIGNKDYYDKMERPKIKRK